MSFHQPRGPLGVISSVTSGFPIASVKGPVGEIADSYADCLAVIRLAGLYGSIIIEFAVMLYHLCCPCLTYAPFKVRGFQYDTVIGPCLHVFRRVTEPFGDVEFLTAVGSVLAFVIFVVPYIQIERAIVYERSRVCRKTCL